MLQADPDAIARPAGPARTSSRGARALSLTGALAVFLGLRLLVLHADFDATCVPAYELTIMGNLAGALRGGWGSPSLAEFYDNCGGHLSLGIGAVPLYALLGDSYLALKLAVLGCGAATLALLWLLLEPRAGTRAAAVAVYAFALLPPGLVQLSTIALGNHFEGLLPILAAYLLWVRWIERPERRARALAFGAVASLSVFLYFGALLPLALMAGAHLFARGPRRWLADLARALPALAAGAAPLVWILLATAGRPLVFLQSNLGARQERDAHAVLARLTEFFSEHLPRGASFREIGPLSAGAGTLAYWLAFTLAFALLAQRFARGLARLSAEPAKRERDRTALARLLPLLAWLPATALVYAASSFEFRDFPQPTEALGYRYLAPLFLLFALLLGAAAGELARRPSALVRAAAALALASALVAAPGAFALVDRSFPRPGLGARYPGRHAPYLGLILLRDGVRDPIERRLDWDAEQLAARLAALPERERRQAAFGVGHYVGFGRFTARRGAERRLRDAVERDLQLVPAELRGPFLEGLGSGLRAVRGVALSDADVAAELAALHEAHPAAAQLAARGLALSIDYPLARDVRRQLAHTRELGDLAPPALRRAWLEGAARACAALLERALPGDRDAAEEWIAALEGAEAARLRAAIASRRQR